jgi:hypothetical protein
LYDGQARGNVVTRDSRFVIIFVLIDINYSEPWESEKRNEVSGAALYHLHHSQQKEKILEMRDENGTPTSCSWEHCIRTSDNSDKIKPPMKPGARLSDFDWEDAAHGSSNSLEESRPSRFQVESVPASWESDLPCFTPQNTYSYLVRTLILHDGLRSTWMDKFKEMNPYNADLPEAENPLSWKGLGNRMNESLYISRIQAGQRKGDDDGMEGP